MASPRTFTARTIPGSHRGRTLGVPTVNLAPEDVPMDLQQGIYACRAGENEGSPPLPAVMHYGPRPVFKDSLSCEVHFLDRTVETAPLRLTVTVVSRMRDVADFPHPQALKDQMLADIRAARILLGVSSAHP